MNLDHDFVQVSKLNEGQKRIGLHHKMELFFSPNLGEDQKKRSSPKMVNTFSPNSGENQKKGLNQTWNSFFPEFKWTPTLRCTPESNYWEGRQDVDN